MYWISTVTITVLDASLPKLLGALSCSGKKRSRNPRTRQCTVELDVVWDGGTSVARGKNDLDWDRRVLMVAKRRILVADDDPSMRELLKSILMRAGYDAIVAEDGLSAVDKADIDQPDLVIIDGLLPKLHGFLACKAIKELIPAPKVILYTAIYTKPTYKWEVKDRYGADDLLAKPAMPADLLACVEKHLAGLPEIDRREPRQKPESTENSPSVSRLVAHNLNQLLEPAPPAGYSATWKPATPIGELVRVA
jgi:CheY-like chemotaxis protein